MGEIRYAGNDAYYADLERKHSQWDRPASYVHGDWVRCTQSGVARWCSEALQQCFDEADESSGWCRMAVGNYTYWSNSGLKLRFFESYAMPSSRHPSATPLKSLLRRSGKQSGFRVNVVDAVVEVIHLPDVHGETTCGSSPVMSGD